MNDDVISEIFIFFAEKIIIFKRFKYDQDISKLLILSPEEISNMKAVSCLNIIVSTDHHIVTAHPTTRIPNSRPSQKPSSADILKTESGIIDPLVSKPPEKF